MALSLTDWWNIIAALNSYPSNDVDRLEMTHIRERIVVRLRRYMAELEDIAELKLRSSEIPEGQPK